MTDEVKHTADTTEKAGGVAVGVADEAVAAAPDTPGDNGRDRTAWRAVLKEPSGLILLIVALVAAAAVTASLWKFQYRLDVQTNTDAAQVAVDAATEGTIALLSYAPETLQEDFAAAKEHLTGEFLDYYTEFTDTVVTPAAMEKQVSTSANVVNAAISEIHPDSAVVLVFLNQMTTSKENPDGAFAASSVKVGLKKVDGRWLIEAFDPV